MKQPTLSMFWGCTVFTSDGVIVRVVISIEWSSENQIIGVWSRTPILLMNLSGIILWKLDCQSWKQQQKKTSITLFDSGPCDWLILPCLHLTLTIWFSTYRKWLSHKQNWKKWKHSDSSSELTNLLWLWFLIFNSDYMYVSDFNSITGESQVLVT